ncbi:MAG TPA: hypothetical protein VLG11_05970 [Candidatus Saccharimonadales bacterium]|nr:hypothetical protein [Candidatus Saccharimonadales bacterium]
MEIINVTTTPEELRRASQAPEFNSLVDATIAFLGERSLPEELTMHCVPREVAPSTKRHELTPLPGILPRMTALRQGDRRPVYTVEADLPLPSTIRQVGMVAAKYSFPLIYRSSGLPVAPPHVISLGYRVAIDRNCALTTASETCWHYHNYNSTRGMGVVGALRAMAGTLREMSDGEPFANIHRLSWVSIPSRR